MLALTPTFDGKRSIPTPEVTRVILELLELTSCDKVLEIGTGSGSQTRKFRESGAEIHSIELEPWVDPTQITGECVFLHAGDGALGLLQEAPFTAIVATCGVEAIPEAWQEQLGEGGRLVAPVGDARAQRLILFKKHDGELRPERVGAYVKFQMMRDRPTVKGCRFRE